ncbi:hypothetical protein [Variovorax sp. OV329]|uniref:hypothetical protein n=1 Tax=Variovorax sp. OV329 TaxID=1882825 RepID=UPI0008E2067F|nr:hypothetical protein [Variovorax sp. OV329]SFM47445.1 hypothetical protein SAMN05444747_105376 [Variovorax sp. OV329]
MTRRGTAIRRLATLACLLLAGGTLAGPPLQRHDETWMAVSDDTLESQRGGFDIGAGLVVSFGITRAVYINGELMTQTTLNFGQLDKITAGQAMALSRQLNALNLVQNGPGNTVEGSLGSVGGTVIQNTLNNQRIANHTVINVETNGLSLMKDLNTAATLNEGIARAVGGR